LAFAWEDGSVSMHDDRIDTIPLSWLGSSEGRVSWRDREGEPLPLAVLDVTCLMRAIACDHLDRHHPPGLCSKR
jgi:hypothetical protein